MNHGVIVCMLNGFTNRTKECESLVDIKTPEVTVFEYRFAFYILHDDIRQAIFSYASIQQPVNIRMIQVSQYLSFTSESSYVRWSIHTAPHKFQSHFLVVDFIGSLGQKHR